MVKVKTCCVGFSLQHGTIIIVITTFLAYGIYFGYTSIQDVRARFNRASAVLSSAISIVALPGALSKISYFLIPFMIMLLLGSAGILFKIHLEISYAGAVLATWSNHSRYSDGAIIELIPRDEQKLYTELEYRYIDLMFLIGMCQMGLFFLNTYFFIVVLSFYSELIKKKNRESVRDPEWGRVTQVTSKSNVQEPQSEKNLGPNKGVASKSNKLNTNG